MYEENCSKTLLLLFFLFSEQNSSIHNFILICCGNKNYLRPGLGLLFTNKFRFLNFFPDNYIWSYVQWKFEKRFNV